MLTTSASRCEGAASKAGGGDVFNSWPLKRILREDKDSVRAKVLLVKQDYNELCVSSRHHGLHGTSYFDGSHRNAVARFLAHAVDSLGEPAFNPENTRGHARTLLI